MTVPESPIMTDIFKQTEIRVLDFLLSGDNRDEKLLIVEMLEPSEFTGVHRQLYKAIVTVLIRNGSCDVVTVSHELKNTGGDELLPAMLSIPTTTYFPDAQYLAMELRNRSKIRRIAAFANDIQSRVSEEPASSLMKKLEDFVFTEESRYQEKMTLPQAFDEISSRVKSGRVMGWNWLRTMPQLTNNTNGIEQGKTYIIGASKKSGKTRFSVACMMSLIEQNIPPLFLSMEMRALELAKLFISAHTGLPAWRWERDITTTNIIGETQRFIDNIMILDTQSHLTVEQVKAKVIRASQRGCKAVFIDFLQRMNFPDTRNKNYATVVADTVARLADIGRDYNVAMVILSQLRNQAEGEEIADMRFLKDSGGIAENADAIITLTNKQRQESGEAKYLHSDKIDFWISVEQRSGATSLIKAVAELGICRFYVPSQSNEPGGSF